MYVENIEPVGIIAERSIRQLKNALKCNRQSIQMLESVLDTSEPKNQIKLALGIEKISKECQAIKEQLKKFYRLRQMAWN